MIIISNQLIISKTAQIEIALIKNYIARDSIYYSEKTIREIYSRINNLIIFPYMGRKIPEYNNEYYREIIYKSYRVFYNVESNYIIILNVFHHSRDFSSLSFLS